MHTTPSPATSLAPPLGMSGLSSPLLPLLALQQVLRRHGKGRRVHFELNVNVEFARAEVVGLFGANGAGKSTLMELIAGKLEPHLGQVHVQGQGLGFLRHRERGRLVRHHPQPHVAVPQAGRHRALVPRLNDAYGFAREALRDLFRDKAAPGGPHIYLYDEPPLEPPYGGLLFDRFAQLRDQGKLVIFSTHPGEPWHLNLIRGVCDRYAFMQDGQLRFIDNFDDFMADPDVADYLGALRPTAAA